MAWEKHKALRSSFPKVGERCHGADAAPTSCGPREL